MDEKDSRHVKPIEQLTIMDSFMFGAVMRDPKLCKPLLELVLKKKIKKIEYIEVEKTIDALYDAKSVRLDVYVEDGDAVYNVEMQVGRSQNLPKRTRLYQGIIDLNIIQKGQDYEKLKKSFIIFICSFDPFGKDRYVYTFRNRCDEDGSLLLGDEAVKVFLNAKGTVGKASTELKSLLRYVDGQKPDSNYTMRLEKAVNKIKNSTEWRREYMTTNMAFWEQRKIGKYENIVSMVRSNRGKVDNDVLVSILGVDDSTFNHVSSCLTEHPDWDDWEIAEAVIESEGA